MFIFIFSMLYNLFHHTPRMIFYPFLVTQQATFSDILALQGGVRSDHHKQLQTS